MYSVYYIGRSQCGVSRSHLSLQDIKLYLLGVGALPWWFQVLGSQLNCVHFRFENCRQRTCGLDWWTMVVYLHDTTIAFEEVVHTMPSHIASHPCYTTKWRIGRPAIGIRRTTALWGPHGNPWKLCQKRRVRTCHRDLNSVIWRLTSLVWPCQNGKSYGS